MPAKIHSAIQYKNESRGTLSHKYPAPGNLLILDTGMRAEKSKQHDYYKDQPTNQPPAIAKAIGALAADDANHGTNLTEYC